MSTGGNDKELLVYDVSEATEEELAEMRKELQTLSDIVLQEAFSFLRDGKYFQCPHTHLEIALSSYKADFPCEDCETNKPEKKEMH